METMCDGDTDKLAEAVYEFDRLMTAQSRDRDVDEVTCDVFEEKPDVDTDGDDDDDDANGGVELTSLPAPDAKDSDKSEEKTVVGRVTRVAHLVYSIVKSDVGLVTILLVYTFLGAVVLHYAEYDREQLSHRQLAGHKRRCIATIINSTTSRSAVDHDELTAVVETLIDEYVEHKEKLRPLSNAPEWTYWGAIFYCGTVYSTVGYGYIYPVTTAGRVITMIYASVGIPLCLVVLAGLGKSLTRAIKFLWSFIRRFYYTGSFRRVSLHIPLSRVRLTLCERIVNRVRRAVLTRRQQTIRAAQTAAAAADGNCVESAVVAAVDAELECLRELDETFVPYEVDDKFDLPPVIALSIAFLYMLLGAFIYTRWENWSYFEAFYFTFISLSTIGFGDVVPEHPKNLMATSVYLLLGLALIAMVVNVVMETVNSTINKAKDRVRDVGRRIVDVAQRQTLASLKHQPAPATDTVTSWTVAPAARTSNRRHSI